MNREVSDMNILDSFCEKFCNVVKKHMDYVVVSGFVAIASGRIRGTEDIDMIIPKISREKFIKLHEELVENGFQCMQSDNPEEIHDLYLKEKTSVRYTYKNRPVPEMEVAFSKDILDGYQIKTKTKLPITGLDIWFSSINMNIAFKEEYLKSGKDLEDARHLRIVFSDMVDEKEIEAIKEMIRKLRL